MKKLLIGLLLVLIPLSFWNGVNYMPAFVGYFLIFLALSKAPGETARSGGTVAVAAAVVTAALWVAGWMGYGMTFPVEPALRVVITWRVLLWCEEQEWELDHLTGRLRKSWYALAGATAASFVLGLFLWIQGVLWTLVAVAAGLYYLYILNRIRLCVDREDGQ